MCHRKLFTQTGRSCLLAMMLLFPFALFAQLHLIFINPSQGKLIKVKDGDQLSLRYKGYLGQTEFFKNTLTEINDSTFLLGIPHFKNKSGGNSQVQQILSCKEIRIEDVLEFRKISVGRSVLKTSLSLTTVVGSVLLLNRLYVENKVSDLGKIGISVGVGIGLNLVINLALPDKPKYKMSEGWQIKSVKE